MATTETQTDYIALLHEAGFGIVQDGTAVIVCGPAERIPIDRPVGAFDSRSATRARRFDSAKDAVRVLIETPARKALAGDTFARIDKSNAAQGAFARR